MAKKASTVRSTGKRDPVATFLKASSKGEAHAEYTTSTTRNVCHNLYHISHQTILLVLVIKTSFTKCFMETAKKRCNKKQKTVLIIETNDKRTMKICNFCLAWEKIQLRKSREKIWYFTYIFCHREQ